MRGELDTKMLHPLLDKKSLMDGDRREGCNSDLKGQGLKLGKSK